jgi:hypothetical protein
MKGGLLILSQPKSKTKSRSWPSGLALSVAFLGFVVCAYELLSRIELTKEGTVAIIAFIVGVISFLFAIWYEGFLAHREIAHTSNIINTTSGIIETESRKIAAQYDEMSIRFMIYPAFKPLIGNHYNLLGEVLLASEKYQSNPELKNLFERYLVFWFSYFIDIDLSACRDDLNNFKLVLEADKMKKFLEFIGLFWESVKENGEIKATSIVKPPPEGSFWQHPEAYLELQKTLIENKKASVYRYFIIAHDHYEQLRSLEGTIKLNIDNKILTRIVLFKDITEAGACYRDIGLVDDLMAVDNDPSETGLARTTCYIKNPQNSSHFSEIARIFTTLEEEANTIKSENYKDNFEGLIDAIKVRIGEVVG